MSWLEGFGAWWKGASALLAAAALVAAVAVWKAEAEDAHQKGREAYKAYQAQAELERERRASGLAEVEAILRLCDAGKLPDDSDECRLARLKADRLRERR